MPGTSRLPPLDTAVMSVAQQQVAEAISSGPRAGVRGPFIALLRNPELAAKVQELGAYLRFGSTMRGDLRELAIILTARWANCEYEWHTHAVLAIKAGIAVEKVRSIGCGKRPGPLTAGEALVYDTVRELLASGTLSDAAYERAMAAFGEAGLVDLLALPGYYFLLALVLNATGVPYEGERVTAFPTLQRFPSELA